MEIKKIVVASKNPVKINSALNGFQQVFPNLQFEAEGVNVPSGVSDQPIGSDETLLGAMNRVNAAQQVLPTADFWVGIEGGNIWHGHEMEAMAWVVVKNSELTGKGRTAGFFLPKRIIELIEQGYELGHADEQVFGVQNSKQKMGSCGLLTDNVIDREQLYIPAVVFALIPFLKTKLEF